MNDVLLMLPAGEGGDGSYVTASMVVSVLAFVVVTGGGFLFSQLLSAVKHNLNNNLHDMRLSIELLSKKAEMSESKHHETELALARTVSEDRLRTILRESLADMRNQLRLELGVHTRSTDEP